MRKQILENVITSTYLSEIRDNPLLISRLKVRFLHGPPLFTEEYQALLSQSFSSTISNCCDFCCDSCCTGVISNSFPATIQTLIQSKYFSLTSISQSRTVTVTLHIKVTSSFINYTTQRISTMKNLGEACNTRKYANTKDLPEMTSDLQTFSFDLNIYNFSIYAIIAYFSLI